MQSEQQCLVQIGLVASVGDGRECYEIALTVEQREMLRCFV